MPRYSFGRYSLLLPVGWANTTDCDATPSAPLTLSKPNGVGALQFSTAIYVAGELPQPTSHVLYDMLLEFLQPHTSGRDYDITLETVPLVIAAASFRFHDGDFVRGWYVSDGLSIARATYICAHDDLGVELIEADRIVRSIRFQGGAA